MEDEDRLKLEPFDLITITIAVLLVAAPEVPDNIDVYVPAIALDDGVKVSVLVEDVLFWLKTAVTPAGNPDMFKVTALLRLTGLTTLIVEMTGFPPGISAKLVIDDSREKLGDNAGVTINVI